MQKGDTKYIADFEESYRLIQHDMAILDILDEIGQATQEYSSLLVKFGDSEVLEVWGINGIPWLWNTAELLYRAPIEALA